MLAFSLMLVLAAGPVAHGNVSATLPPLEDAILAEPPAAALPAARNAWDGSTPKYFDQVQARWALSDEEKALLTKNGFVVSGRFQQAGWADALHEVHRSEQPLFVSSDAIFHAVFRSHEEFLSRTEREVLAPRLVRIIRAMHASLPAVRSLWPREIGNDVEFYLRMARLLAIDDGIEARPEEAAWISRIRGARGVQTVTLFGRARRIDFSRFQPRGHYVQNQMEDYFRLYTWLAYVEFNLASRACASSSPAVSSEETPREALVALALADLAERSGSAGDLAAIERLLSAFAGPREDVSLAELSDLRKHAGIKALDESAAPALRAAISTGFDRQVNHHVMPDADISLRPLPVIATILGPRATPEAQSLGAISYDLSALKMAYVLGHDRALLYLPRDSEGLAEVKDARGKLRAEGADLYSQWLRAVMSIATRWPGVTPSFADREAFRDKQLDSALVAYGQLRHNHVLIAGEPYGEGGCRVPDAYVEPAVAVYESLESYAKAGEAAAAELPTLGARELGARAKKYFARMQKLMQVLEALSKQELANQPLSENGQSFLAAVVELYALTATYVNTWQAKYDGWYFALFFGDVKETPEFIASVFSSPRRNLVQYVGARMPEMGFFVVDTGGVPRLMVGPVARGFVVQGSLARRFDDEQVKQDLAHRKFASGPWSAGYRSAETGLVQLFASDEAEFTAWVQARGPVVFRARGEHGALLWTSTIQSAPLHDSAFEGPGYPQQIGKYTASLTIPAEILKSTRIVTAEFREMVAEAKVPIRRSMPEEIPPQPE